MGEAMVSNALLSKLMLLFLALCPLVPITLRLSSTVPILRIDNHPIVINCPESTCRKIEQSGHLYARNLTQPKEKQPIDFSKKELRGKKIALVNFERENDDHIKRWENLGETTVVRFDVVPENLEWKQLFPEWIDEDEERQIPECPEIPMPNFGDYGEFDAVVSRLPCFYPKEGWARDVFRLQVHLVSGNLAVRNGRKNGDTVVAFLSSCRPMIEIFRCDDLVKREGDWWIFKPDLKRLRQKVVSLPVGSCKLAVPLVKQGKEFYLSRMDSGQAFFI